MVHGRVGISFLGGTLPCRSRSQEVLAEVSVSLLVEGPLVLRHLVGVLNLSTIGLAAEIATANWTRRG